MNVPFVDLKSQYNQLRNEVLPRMTEVLDNTQYILGEELKRFEEDFAKYIGVPHALGVASGLEALHLAFRALEIGQGHEVVLPAHTFIASALGVTHSGAKPVLVDVNEKTFLMDDTQMESAITSKTRAILPVHLYGRMMNLDRTMTIAKQKNLQVVEDAAQSHGAKLGGKTSGAVGAIGCFSFYPGKNLGAYGDGGMVVTSDPQLKSRLESLRNYGSPKKYHHPIIGYNSRLDTLQAAVLRVKLKYLDSYNQARADAALRYNHALEGVGDLVLPEVPGKGTHVFHLYVIRTKKRDALLQYLNENGVSSGIHYPLPIHLQEAYADLGYKRGAFPVSEKLTQEILSLPMFPELSEAQISYAAETIRKFFAQSGKH